MDLVRPVTILVDEGWLNEQLDIVYMSFCSIPPLLCRLLLTALLLLLRLVMISNSSRSEAGEVIAPTGDGRFAGS